jgi:hypothetical protein
MTAVVMLANIEALKIWALGLLPWAGFFLAAALLDLVGGIAISLYQKKFDAEQLPRFLTTGLMFFWAWVTTEVFAFMPDFFGAEPTGWLSIIADYGPKGVFALIMSAKYGTSIWRKVKFVLDEIQAPDFEE